MILWSLFPSVVDGRLKPVESTVTVLQPYLVYMLLYMLHLFACLFVCLSIVPFNSSELDINHHKFNSILGCFVCSNL